MMPPGSMQPVFPEEPAPVSTPEIEAQVNAAAAVKSRAAYLAGLQQDSEFHAHVIDGLLKDLETQKLATLRTCPAAEVIEARSEWKAIEALRSSLRDELQNAAQKVKS